MGIAIRETKLVNNRIRLSLDIYHQGKSKFENLRLYVFEKPKTLLEKDHNKRTRQLAESIKAKKVLELQEGQYNIHTGFKSQSSFTEYFKKLTRERKGIIGSYGTWYATCRHLAEFTNRKDITFEKCNDKFLNDFKTYLLNQTTIRNKKLLPSSAALYLTKIKTALKQAEDERLILDNPGRRVKAIKSQESQRQYLLLEEIKLLTKQGCKIPMLKKAFLFSCLTGLRWSDMIKLTWRDITYSDTERIWKIVFTQVKTKSREWLPITQQAYNILGVRGEAANRIFKGLQYNVLTNKSLAEWVLEAGINKHITYHCSRHTFATLLLTNGADIFTVSKLLGHRDIITTQIYGKIIDTKKNTTVDLLPNIGM